MYIISFNFELNFKKKKMNFKDIGGICIIFLMSRWILNCFDTKGLDSFFKIVLPNIIVLVFVMYAFINFYKVYCDKSTQNEDKESNVEIFSTIPYSACSSIDSSTLYYPNKYIMNIVLARDGFARILYIKTTNKCSCQTKFSYNSTVSVLCPSPIGLTNKAVTWLSMEIHRKQFSYEDYDGNDVNINAISTVTSENNNVIDGDNSTTADVKDQKTDLTFLRVKCRQGNDILSRERLDVLKKAINWSLITLIMYQRYTHLIFNSYE